MNTRLIAKVEIKNQNIVKPIYFEGLKKIGNPKKIIQEICRNEIDEIIYLDLVASLYERKLDLSLLKENLQNIFVPTTVGGGIRSIEDCNSFFECGADKISINTYALQTNKNLINTIAKKYGSQSVVVNIEAKKINKHWYCFSDNGRIDSNVKVDDWIKIVQDLGAGELFIQSVDKDGTKSGYDIELYDKIFDICSIPVIIGSGAGSLKDIEEIIKLKKPEAICLSSLIYDDFSIIDKIKILLEKYNDK